MMFMNPVVMQLSLLFLVVGTLLLLLVKKLKHVMSANGKKGLFYLLAALLLFAVGAIFSLETLFQQRLLINYAAMVLYFALVGTLHIFAMEAFLQWEDELKSYAQPVFTLVTALIGAVGFINVADYFGLPGFHLYLLPAILAFLVPLLFRQLWLMLVYFPVPLYVRWHYPIARNISMPDTDELRNLRIVSLEFNKVPNAPKSIFKAKAPENMNFGKFFYHFINDYNHRTPEAPIAFKDENNQAYGWSFYLKPNLLGLTRNINPELTVNANKLMEHCTIVCERVVEVKAAGGLQKN